MAATLEQVVAPVEADADDPRPAAGWRRAGGIALLLLPAAIILWCGWQRRWTADDGFLRIGDVPDNFAEAVRSFGFRFDEDPIVAAREVCAP